MTEYQTVDGEAPAEFVAHTPRTITRVEGEAQYMMTEIGDGVFVQWGECARCAARTGTCACTQGPQEPDYIAAWREARFEKSFNARPAPEMSLLPAIEKLLTSRNLMIVPIPPEPVSVEDEEQAPDDIVPDDEVYDEDGEFRHSTAFERPEDNVYVVPDSHALPETTLVGPDGPVNDVGF